MEQRKNVQVAGFYCIIVQMSNKMQVKCAHQIEIEKQFHCHNTQAHICPNHTADATKPFCRVGVGGVNMNSQLAQDDCRRIQSTIWKLTKQTP